VDAGCQLGPYALEARGRPGLGGLLHASTGGQWSPQLIPIAIYKLLRSWDREFYQQSVRKREVFVYS
jgi:hypothetical protein